MPFFFAQLIYFFALKCSYKSKQNIEIARRCRKVRKWPKGGDQSTAEHRNQPFPPAKSLSDGTDGRPDLFRGTSYRPPREQHPTPPPLLFLLPLPRSGRLRGSGGGCDLTFSRGIVVWRWIRVADGVKVSIFFPSVRLCGMSTAAAPAGQKPQGGAAAAPAKRKPVFVKVDQLKPGTSGHTLTVKVVSSNMVLQKGRASSAHLRETRIAECLIGDETGTIVFTARNEQGSCLCSPF